MQRKKYERIKPEQREAILNDYKKGYDSIEDLARRNGTTYGATYRVIEDVVKTLIKAPIHARIYQSNLYYNKTTIEVGGKYYSPTWGDQEGYSWFKVLDIGDEDIWAVDSEGVKRSYPYDRNYLALEEDKIMEEL